MRNPLRSESEAFRFLLLVIGYCVLIVIGSLINRWLGLAIFVVESGLVAWYVFFRGHFSPEHHHGVEIGGIYWHFVDVMWIIVYVTVYLL